MFGRRGLLAFTVLSLLAFPAAAQQQIGTTHRVTPAAQGSMSGTLAVGSGVHADETIGTDKAGVAGLRFHDQSTLDVGAKFQCAAQQVIYDPNRGGGKAVLDAAKGSFRFSTGAQGGNRNYQVKAPYGTLGIRG